MTAIPERVESEERGNDSRRRAPFTAGDLAAIATGGFLVVSMIVWFSFQVVQNVVRDRAVTEGRPPSPVRSH